MSYSSSSIRSGSKNNDNMEASSSLTDTGLPATSFPQQKQWIREILVKSKTSPPGG